MQRVFVLDPNQQPLMPCQPARARMLLREGRAAVYRRFPFTIILKAETGTTVQPMQVKLDPGATTSGIALVAEFKHGKSCVWAGEISHRGEAIKAGLDQRRAVRRSRRARKTRYRQARFLNRRRAEGWLPPSLQSRVDNLETWVRRLLRGCPVSTMALERVRFDTQKLVNAEIDGVEYQQGELMGYEVREYLLEKWERTCAYCGAQHLPLEVEHLIPRSRGGSDWVSNLTLACRACNQRKDNQTADEFGYPHLMAQARQPLRAAAAVNATRNALYRVLIGMGLPVEVGTGGQTKYNRVQQGYYKTHWLDAVCVGASGATVRVHPHHDALHIQAVGRGSRQMCRMDKYGFPRTSAKSVRTVNGFKTGDLIKAVVGKGKHVGTYVGRVAVRATGYFNVTTTQGVKQGIRHTDCRRVHRADGYSYLVGSTSLKNRGRAAPPSPQR
jgi:5-methylcytosine-specific restriction endonuclease McrA